MSLRDLMAADFATFMQADDFASTVTVTPAGQTALTFSLSGVMGDHADTFVESGGGMDRVTEATLVVQRSAWRAAIANLGFDARDALRGDLVSIAAPDASAGDWTVVGCQADVGDGLNILCRRPAAYQAGVRGAFEVT